MLHVIKYGIIILFSFLMKGVNAKVIESAESCFLTDSLGSENIQKALVFDSLHIQLFAKLGLEPNNAKCADFYRNIFEWIGTPYRYGGNSKKGIDCSRLVIRLTKNMYYDTINGSAATMYNNIFKLEKEQLSEGDLVFFKINKSYISHVGVYLYDGLFVHSTIGKGVMINSLDEKYYKKYFFGAGRYLD